MRTACDILPARRAAVALLCTALALAASAGCAVHGKSIAQTVVPGLDYERLFPRYVEICAVSQIRSTFAPPGGSPGHAVMYLKGACIDADAGYPRLKLCDPAASDLASGETGTGVSVNKVLKNVNWLAIPGRSLFFRGNLAPDEVLDEGRAVAAVLEARDRGVFRGVEAHEKYLPPEGDELRRLYFAEAETLGTDFALSFGRTSYCARLPVTEQVLAQVVGYLNGLNDQYASGEADYNWSGYSDNCAHALHNALAAAGVWKSQSVNATKLRQFFNLAVPANEFASLAFLSVSERLDDPWALYQDPVLRKTLLEQDWLPIRHGAVLTYLPVHQRNQLYETDPTIFVLEMPLLRFRSRRIRGMYYDPRFSDLEANLRWFEKRYERILERRPGNWDSGGPEGSYGDFRRRYYSYIERQLAEVREMLVRRVRGRGSPAAARPSFGLHAAPPRSVPAARERPPGPGLEREGLDEEAVLAADPGGDQPCRLLLEGDHRGGFEVRPAGVAPEIVSRSHRRGGAPSSRSRILPPAEDPGGDREALDVIVIPRE